RRIGLANGELSTFGWIERSSPPSRLVLSMRSCRTFGRPAARSTTRPFPCGSPERQEPFDTGCEFPDFGEAGPAWLPVSTPPWYSLADALPAACHAPSPPRTRPPAVTR